jgi:ATP-dependent Clp protease ATP-binding subunit ClpA
MTEHLLLGILREDERVVLQLSEGAPEAIRKELGQLAPPDPESAAVSGDLPLSEDSKSALMFATEEADALGHKQIDTPHLVLGLLRVYDCAAATLLRKHGTAYDRYRNTLT